MGRLWGLGSTPSLGAGEAAGLCAQAARPAQNQGDLKQREVSRDFGLTRFLKSGGVKLKHEVL